LKTCRTGKLNKVIQIILTGQYALVAVIPRYDAIEFIVVIILIIIIIIIIIIRPWYFIPKGIKKL